MQECKCPTLVFQVGTQFRTHLKSRPKSRAPWGIEAFVATLLSFLSIKYLLPHTSTGSVLRAYSDLRQTNNLFLKWFSTITHACICLSVCVFIYLLCNVILWPPDAKNWLIGKDPDAGKDWRWEEKGTTDNEMAGWHHRLDGHEFEQALSVGDGQGSLVHWSPWGHRVGHNWTELNILYQRRDHVYYVHWYIFSTLSEK